MSGGDSGVCVSISCEGFKEQFKALLVAIEVGRTPPAMK